MITKRQEIINMLEHVSEPDIEIEHGKDAIHVKITTHARMMPSQKAAGKWTQFADEMHAESPLKGRSEQLNSLIRAFRNEFSFDGS